MTAETLQARSPSTRPGAAASAARCSGADFAENRGAVAGLVVMLRARCSSRRLADVIAPHSPIEQFREHFLTPPVWQAGRHAGLHPLGTDDVGRDMLSRLIYGARLSLLDRHRRWSRCR